MSFFAERKRRSVFRVGIAYLIGAWLLAKISDLLIDNIGAPDWVMPPPGAMALRMFRSH